MTILKVRKNWKKSASSDTLPGVPRKIRQLVPDLEAAGFVRVHGGKGSQSKVQTCKVSGICLISGHDSDDAQHYQEKQVRNALRRI